MCSIGNSLGINKRVKGRITKSSKKASIFLGENRNNITFLKILLNYHREKAPKSKRKFRKVILNTAKTSLDLDQIDINSKESSSSLVRIPSAERVSMRLTLSPPEVFEDTVDSNTIEVGVIEPVSLPEEDPHPVKVGHNFLLETSFEEPEVK